MDPWQADLGISVHTFLIHSTIPGPIFSGRSPWMLAQSFNSALQASGHSPVFRGLFVECDNVSFLLFWSLLIFSFEKCFGKYLMLFLHGSLPSDLNPHSPGWARSPKVEINPCSYWTVNHGCLLFLPALTLLLRKVLLDCGGERSPKLGLSRLIPGPFCPQAPSPRVSFLEFPTS